MKEGEIYRIESYPEKLSSPKLFPIQGAMIWSVETGHPDTFSDGFIMELKVLPDEKERLTSKSEKIVSKVVVDDFIAGAKGRTLLLSEPKYIICCTFGPAYILFTPSNTLIGMQVKYYNYLQNRYPGCQFYTNDDIMSLKPVRLDNKLVALVMPVMLDQRTLEKLEEVAI